MITEVPDNLQVNPCRIKLILENKPTNQTHKHTPLVLVFSSLQLHEFAPKGILMYVIYPPWARGAVKSTKEIIKLSCEFLKSL